MIYVISPAKKLDETPLNFNYATSNLEFVDKTKVLINQLQNLEPSSISNLMNISSKLAELNYERFQQWKHPFPENKSKPALFMFQGDVYKGLDSISLKSKSLNYLHNKLYILSGLYGLLGALDNILPYRLEMGTKLVNASGKDLYAFWGDLITEKLNIKLEKEQDKILINLASNEYFKAINTQKLNAKVITPIFKDWKNGKYKIISFYAKKARGLMARYAAENKIEQADELKYFDKENYSFSVELSTELDWVFTRNL